MNQSTLPIFMVLLYFLNLATVPAESLA